ncbi:MAG TPA: hypothetical protein VGQ09_21885 [Chitinophagaceae bacterium]|jgi:hypothetical protein|nr:hypothetical protein [Chitinophagaceae bacterium]
MKRILLVITFGLFALTSKTQTVFNGKYGDTITLDKELPVKLIYFFGSMNDNRLTLRWNVADNESVNLFEVQKSYDGKNFITAGLLFSSEKDGNETYFFPEILTGQEKIFYCLKMIDKHQRIKYSKVLSFQPALVEKNYLASIKYPVIIK